MTAPEYVRAFGGLLQIAGVLIVAREIGRTRRSFIPSHRSARQRFTDKWWSFAGWIGADAARARREDARVEAEAVGAITAVGSLRARAITAPGPGKTIEQKTEWLLNCVDELQRDMDQAIEAHKTALEKVDAAAQKRHADARRELQRIEKSLRDFAIGGLRLRAWQAMMIAIGIAMATWPGGVVRFIPWL